jgi:hypothetical protein
MTLKIVDCRLPLLRLAIADGDLVIAEEGCRLLIPVADCGNRQPAI